MSARILLIDDSPDIHDLVELALDLDGVKVRLTDTAGIREAEGRVEAMGIERAIKRAEAADLVLVLTDASNPDPGAPVDNPNFLAIRTKADLLNGSASDPRLPGVPPPLFVSSLTGQGIPELLDFLSTKAKAAAGSAGDVLPSRLRHVALLAETAAHLNSALEGEGRGLELRADDLRAAADRLGRISGAVDVEDLLDAIFSQFCIGK